MLVKITVVRSGREKERTFSVSSNSHPSHLHLTENLRVFQQGISSLGPARSPSATGWLGENEMKVKKRAMKKIKSMKKKKLSGCEMLVLVASREMGMDRNLFKLIREQFSTFLDDIS